MREVFTSEDGIAIEVDLEIDEMSKEFPWLFSLFLKFDLEKESQDKIEEFYEMKESIILTLEKNGLVKYAGQRAIDSWVELYFYAMNSKNLLTNIKTYLNESKLMFEQGVVRDTKWDFYTANLMPNELEYCYMESQKIVNLLKEEGDSVNVSREVEHYAMFDTATQKQRFIENVNALGFEYKDDIATDECEHGVALLKKHTLKESDLRVVIKELYDASKIEHGYYELWSTTLAESK